MTQTDGHSYKITKTEIGEKFTTAPRPGPRLVESLSEDSGTLQDVVPCLFPGLSSSSPGPRLGKVEGLQEKA